MLSGRFGEAWFLECTRISFWEFFSLTSTGRTLALQYSWLGETGIPREVKKEWCISECVWVLFPPGVASDRGVWRGDWGGFCQGEASLKMCFLLPWKDQPSFKSSWSFLKMLIPRFPSPTEANGLAFVAEICAYEFDAPRIPKLNLVFGVHSASAGCLSARRDLSWRWLGEADGLAMAWPVWGSPVGYFSSAPALDFSSGDLLVLIVWGGFGGRFVWTLAIVRVEPLPMAKNPLCAFGGYLALLVWAKFWCGTLVCGTRAAFSLSGKGLLGWTFPSHVLVLITLHARVWWPNLRHFRHWFERPE